MNRLMGGIPPTVRPSAMRSAVVAVLLAILLLPALAGPVSSQSQAVVWQDYDVTLDVQANGQVRVTERQVVDFNGGPFRTAFANIPTNRIDAIGNVGVAEEVNGVL